MKLTDKQATELYWDWCYKDGDKLIECVKVEDSIVDHGRWTVATRKVFRLPTLTGNEYYQVTLNHGEVKAVQKTVTVYE